jgi:hypothetical protein
MDAQTVTTINGGGYIPAPMRQLAPTEDKFARAQARGWNDVRDGKGFRDDYDKWNRKVQFAYERGRFRATLAKTMLAEGRKNIAVWKRDETISSVLDRSCGFASGQKILNDTATVRQRRAS